MARAGIALPLANVRYWATVAPVVRAQLTRWERRAQAIEDPFLRTLAISKLREERFNVELAATLATPAPRAHRKRAAEAIVALQVLYDYLDLLTEQPLSDPLPDSRRLFAALIDALTLAKKPRGDYYPHDLRSRDDGYLEELVKTTRDALARLPGAAAVVEVAQRSARRCAEAQVLSHAAARSGSAEAQTLSHAAARSSSAEVERWARREATGTPLQWPEFLAGATASVLAVHALIAAAADERTTIEAAQEIDALYLSIGALTMLDSLVDHQHDIATGELGYVQYYESPEMMAVRLVSVARDAAERARALPNAAHHIMTLIGVVAYYSSAPAASSAFALPVTEHMRGALGPLITPTLALMRAWRLAKRVNRRRGRFGGG